MSWTNERVAEATQIWIGGHSATEIARALGGVTRNGVISKLNRIGVAGPKGQCRIAPKPKPVRQEPAVIAAPAPRSRPALSIVTPQSYSPPASEPPSGALLLMDRQIAQCAWPVGEDGAGRALCCGAGTGDRKRSFCAEHARLAYVPTKPMRPIFETGVTRRRQEIEREDQVIALDGRRA